jgi:hypothetical protein
VALPEDALLFPVLDVVHDILPQIIQVLLIANDCIEVVAMPYLHG